MLEFKSVFELDVLQKNFDLFEDDDAINGIVNSENIEPPVSDIEDLVSDDEDEQLDKARYICSNPLAAVLNQS